LRSAQLRGAALIGQILRYGAVVAGGYLLAIAFYAGELDVGVHPYPALGVAFVLNALFNFALLRVWAFPPSGRSVAGDLRRFGVVAAASFAVNYSCFAALYSLIGLPALVSQRLAILIAAPVTFLANRLWSFRGGAPATSEWRIAAARSRQHAGARGADNVPNGGHEQEIGRHERGRGPQAPDGAPIEGERAWPTGR
jgi:putative flippase GtrA